MKNLIVKRRGQTETFDERKLYASIYSACSALRTPSSEAELIAAEVTERVKQWLNGKHEVTSNDIQLRTNKHLAVLNHEAAYLYDNHDVIN
ncbi:hypothetical protein KBC31_02840 [Candidatus Saccharibacteria bacterium]|nr:hypothetical protein [Candidatus Saccharibacteria bacterium]